ncbi:uncharacterized protein A4U43_C01F28610, partial [Asparagus officinalis]
KGKRRATNRMMYSPPSPVYSQKRATVVKSVNFGNQNPIYVIPPQTEPVRSHCPSVHTHYSAPPVQSHHPGPAVQNHYSDHPPVQSRNPEPTTPHVPNGPSPSQENQGTKPKRKGKKKTRFAPEPDIQKNNLHTNPVQHESIPNCHGPIHQEPCGLGPRLRHRYQDGSTEQGVMNILVGSIVTIQPPFAKVSTALPPIRIDLPLYSVRRTPTLVLFLEGASFLTWKEDFDRLLQTLAG